MVTEGHYLRCADEAKKHFHNNRIQGFADGQLDAESPEQTGRQAAAQDLSSMKAQSMELEL